MINRSQNAKEVKSTRYRCYAQHSWHTRKRGSEDRKTSSQNKGLRSKVHSIEPFAHPSFLLGNTNYDYNKPKGSFFPLIFLPDKNFNFMKVAIILGQDSY